MYALPCDFQYRGVLTLLTLETADMGQVPSRWSPSTRIGLLMKAAREFTFIARPCAEATVLDKRRHVDHSTARTAV